MQWVLVAVIATLFVAFLHPAQSNAAVGINSQISFEGKVVNASGVNLADGNYNMEYKIYQDGTGCVVTGSSPCGGTLKWTEDHLVSNTTYVKVTAGTFQVNLGSSTALSAIDFNQDTLWLSMQVGSTSSCTPAGAFQANCGGDGEMLPFIRLTSVPYAVNSGAIGGLTASQLVQLTPAAGVQTGTVNVTGNITSTAGTLQAGTIDAPSSGTITVGSTANTTGVILNQNTTITSGKTLSVGGQTVFSATGILQAAAISSSVAYSNLTQVGTITAGTWNATAIGAQYGGTGQSTYTVGDLLYASGSTTLSKLSDVATGSCLISGGVATAPTWGSCGAGSGVTSVGAFSTTNTDLKGATIAGTVITFQAAGATAPGLVSVGTQTFAGGKTFTSGTTVATNNAAAFTVQNASNSVLFNADTVGGQVSITGGSAGATIASVNKWDAHGTNIGTLAISPSTVGNLVTLAIYIFNPAISVNSVTGGGATNWTKVTSITGASSRTELWQATVSTTGASTITATYSASPGNTTELAAQEFTAGLGPSTSWTAATSGTNVGGSSTTVPYPTLTSTQAGELYWGFSADSGAGSAGATSGFTYATTGNNDEIAYNTNTAANTAYSPTSVQAPAGTDYSVAAIYLASAGTALAVHGATTISSTASPSAFQVQNSGGTTLLNVDASSNIVSTNGSLLVQTATNSTTAFQIQNAAGVSVLLVDTSTSLSGNFLNYGGFEVGTAIPTGWSVAGTPTTFARNTSAPNHYGGQASLQLVTTATAGQGGTTTSFTSAPPAATYTVSFYALVTSGTAMNGNNFQVAVNGGAATTCNATTASLSASGFSRVTCVIAAGATVTSMTISENVASIHTFYIDGVQMVTGNNIVLPYTVAGGIELRGAIDSPVVFQALSNSTTAFQIQNTAGTSNLFVADTLNNQVTIAGNVIASTSLAFSGSGTVTSGGTSDVSVDTSNSANAVNIGNTTAGTINIAAGTSAHTINIGNTGSATTQTITIGNASTSSKLTLNGGVSNVGATGVFIGSSTTDANQINLQLDSANAYADAGTCSTTVNQGAMYYNTSTNAVRSCNNGAWEDLVSTGGLGIMLYGVVPDSGTVPGDLESTSNANVSGPCKVSWASATSVAIQACTTYSGGRKVVQPAVTATLPAMAINTFTHLCYYNGTIATGPITNATTWFTTPSTTETASLPTFNANNPIVCLATIKNSASTANTITQVYDTRVFTTSQKQFTNSSVAVAPGWITINTITDTTKVTTTATAGTRGVAGAVVSGSSAAWVSGGPNAIIATSGMIEVESTAGLTSAYNYLETGTAAGYAAGTAIAPTYGAGQMVLGLSLTTFGACTTPSAASCQGSTLTNMKPF